MLDEQLDREQNQLVKFWQSVVAKRQIWITDGCSQVKNIVAMNSSAAPSASSVSSWLRQFHDKLGFKAKGLAANGGLCAGAIFRTQRFIQTEFRGGSKKDQSVHIEHTVPICVLRAQILSRSFVSYEEALTWLLKHSVTTAFHNSEKAHLTDVSRTSNAFEPTSPDHLRPFSRYSKMFAGESCVWNVFDRKIVEPQSFGFDDNIALVLRLLHEVKADRAMLQDIERFASGKARSAAPRASAH
jgi:hypothetical protein